MSKTSTIGTVSILLVLSGCGESLPCPPIEGATRLNPATPQAFVDPTELAYAPELGIDFETMAVLAEGFYCLDDPRGDGAEAEPGATVSVHYTGYHPDGSVFDSSRDRGPFSVLLGAGQVIPGWDVGLLGMRVGGTRTLVIPPHLAYGAQGAGDAIPPNAVLVFEVELIEVD